MSPRPAAMGVTGEPHGGIRTLLGAISDGRPQTIREVLSLVQFSPGLEGEEREKCERTVVLSWLRRAKNPHSTLLAQLLLKNWITDSKYDSFFPERDRKIQLPPKPRYYFDAADV